MSDHAAQPQLERLTRAGLWGYDIAADRLELSEGTRALLAPDDSVPVTLARALGDNWSVVLRRHGAAAAGRTIAEMTFRSVNLRDNADLQYRAATLGHVSPLTPGEAAKAGEFNLRPHPVKRAWDYWVSRLED